MTGWSDLQSFAESYPFAIVYDGDCPFCNAFVRLIRLEAAVGKVDMFDARQYPELVLHLRANGYEINEGMLVFQSGRAYFGKDAMYLLALHTTRSGFFNSVTARAFANPLLAKLLYPVFKFARRIVLFVLGRSRI